MKLSAQEEYGLRCLLHIAGRGDQSAPTIPEISRAEGLSQPYVAKLLRVLRKGGFIKSVRGQAGGYTLSRPAEDISVGEVLALLGGRIFEAEFCNRYPGTNSICNHTVDCGVRSLWRAIQKARTAVRKSSRPIAAARLKAELKKFIEREPAARVEYVEVFDPETMVPKTKITPGSHLALAVFIGKTRLIDNAKV